MFKLLFLASLISTASAFTPITSRVNKAHRGGFLI